MQLSQDILLFMQRHYVGMQVTFMLLTLGDQNTARLRTIIAPNSCQGVRIDVRENIDNNDGRLGDNLRELIVLIKT